MDMEIREKAEQILKESCGEAAAPIDLSKILERYDIVLKQTDFKKIYPQSDVSGLLVSNDGQTEIHVNTSDMPERQRFTIAHELGHYFFQPDCLVDGHVEFRNNTSVPHERQADVFAAMLLMPQELVQQEYYNLLFPSLALMADKFNVSRPAMARRLQELGLWYFE